jgi:hypothetical protein
MFGHDATKLKGFILVDGKEVAETRVCCHCQKHWVVKPGSGITRGFCVKCHGYVCGAPACVAECRPFEARLDAWEAFWNKGKLPKGGGLPIL